CMLHLLTALRPQSTLFPYTTLFRSPSCSRRVSTNHVESAALRDSWTLDRAGDRSAGEGGRTRRIRRIRSYRIWSKTANIGRYSADRKSTRLNSSHVKISYAVFCLKK